MFPFYIPAELELTKIALAWFLPLRWREYPSNRGNFAEEKLSRPRVVLATQLELRTELEKEVSTTLGLAD